MNADLAATALMALLATAAVGIDAPLWLRLPLGLAATLVAPGYALSMATLPRGRLDAIERSALAFSLSIGAVVVAAPLIDVLPGGLTEQAMVASLAALTLGATLVAWLRRPPPRATPDARSPATSAAPTGVGRPMAAAALVLVGIGVASFAIADGTRNASTEFYLVHGGPDAATSSGAPAPVLAGQTIEIDVGLTNAGAAQRYEVEVRGPTGLLEKLEPFDVAAGLTWTGRVRFHLDVPGDDVAVDIVLLRPPNAAPYRALRLVLDVIAPA
ncbi:MAG: DUF1616 domain-containing protein [Chloroflexota bacterium]